MRVGIVGVGFVGEAVARLASRAGDEVMISNSRGPDSLADLAESIGCAAGTAAEAAAFGDVVLLAVPLKTRFDLPNGALAGKVVVDANNYYPHRDGTIDALENGATTTSELIQAALPGSRIVKGFNAILARDLLAHSRPGGSPRRRALPIASNDKDALQIAAAWTDSLGYDTVDAGSLSESWRFERARPGYCQPMDARELARTLAGNTRSSWVEEGSWRL